MRVEQLETFNHTYSLPRVHFSMATPNCPMLEPFPEPCWAEPLPPRRPLFVGEPEIRRDVLAIEPAPAGHPLIGHPSVVMTPHSAWYSEEAMRDLQRLLAEDVLRVLRGEPPRCLVAGPRH